jgi:hypothetical protein
MRTITTFLVSILAVAAPRDLNRVSELPDIARLHSSIQLRFLDRTAFGMSRILPNQHRGIREFRPENATEQSITSTLQDKGYEVALFLAGRGVLTDRPVSANSLLLELARRRNLPQGPAFITKIAKAGELPSQDALLAAGRAGFAALENVEAYDVAESGWTVAMRALRANGTCVGCHAGTKAGDTLGVAMYVYRKGDAGVKYRD